MTFTQYLFKTTHVSVNLNRHEPFKKYIKIGILLRSYLQKIYKTSFIKFPKCGLDEGRKREIRILLVRAINTE